MKLTDLDKNSRLWLYQANRALNDTEIVWMNERLESFAKEWAAHGNQLKAAGEVLNPYFVALAVDTEAVNASGCSIDSSVRFIKQAGQELGIDFFNRLKLVVEDESGDIEYVSYARLGENPDFMVFNPLVDRVGDLAAEFKITPEKFLALSR